MVMSTFLNDIRVCLCRTTADCNHTIVIIIITIVITYTHTEDRTLDFHSSSGLDPGTKMFVVCIYVVNGIGRMYILELKFIITMPRTTIIYQRLKY